MERLQLKDKPLLKYSYNDKIVCALKLSTRTGMADNVSKNIGASRCSLYKWNISNAVSITVKSKRNSDLCKTFHCFFCLNYKVSIIDNNIH